MWTSPELVAEDFVESYLGDEKFPLDLKRISLSVEKKLNIEIYFHELEMPCECQRIFVPCDSELVYQY